MKMVKNKRKYHGDQNSDNPITTKGRSVQSLVQEENAKLLEEANQKEAIYKLFNASTIKGLAHRRFILASFSSHCRTHKGQYVPAEGAMIELSIKDGICGQWHDLLRPGKIPTGFRSECLDKARKTHNIPLDRKEIFNDDHVVLEKILKVVFASSVDINPQPGMIC